jgi:hypothetical protein
MKKLVYSMTAAFLCTLSPAFAAPALAPVVTMPMTAVAGGSTVNFEVTPSGNGAPYTFSWAQISGPLVTLLPTGTDTRLSFSAPLQRPLIPVVFVVSETAQGGIVSQEMAAIQVNNPASLLARTTLALDAGFAMNEPIAGFDSDGDAVTFVLVSGPAGAGIQGNNLLWQNPLPGTHVFVLRATDGALDNSGQSSDHTLTLTVGAYADKEVDEGGSGSLSVGGALLLMFAALASPLLRRVRQK